MLHVAIFSLVYAFMILFLSFSIDEKDQKSRPVVRHLNWVCRFIFNIGILYPNLILRKLFRPKNERISLFHDAS